MTSVPSEVAAPRGVRLAVVMPVYNDWASLFMLLPALDRAFAQAATPVSVIAVDDGSTQPVDSAVAAVALAGLGVTKSIEVLQLITNVGHQRAIAIGLADVVACGRYTHVLVMDADGEDRPQDAVRLLRCALEDGAPAAGTVFVAQRARRSEGLAFRAYYALYKALFRLLSGQLIDFGNFSLLPIAAARRLINAPESWNHFAASLVKGRLPLRRVPSARGRRLAGRSSMNLVSLVTLGLSAISVYSEAVFVRMLLASVALSFVAAAGLIGVVATRLFSSVAIPGWATNAGGLLAIMLVQALTLSAIASFLALNARSGIPTVPATDAARFVERREVLVRAAAEVR